MTYQWRLNGQPLAGQSKSTIILTNLQMADAGSYDVVVGNSCGSTNSQAVTLGVDPKFTKISRGAIVEDVEPWSSPAWGDYDNDGLLDVFVPNAMGTGPNALYRNLGGDEFLRVTNALTAAIGMPWGAQCADVDNDGDLDVFIQRPYGLSGGVVARNEMFRNDGGFVFTRLTNLATTMAANWTDATWVDHDRDGWLDLFATTQRVQADAPLEDFFFHNLTDGRFAAWTASDVGVVVADRSQTGGPAWCDVDGDGDLDLYVSKIYGGETNFLYRNDDGRLIPVRAGSLPARRPTYCALWSDFNNDGLFDLFTGGENGTNMLHMHRGNWVFEDATVASGLALAGNVYTASAGDFDNDGDLDLYVTVFDGADVLYVNQGDGTFTRTSLALLTEGSNNIGLWIDYNNDGFLDLFQTCGFGTPARNLLYRNSLPQHGNTNHWLKLCLKGKASNASAIGARVWARATIGGRDTSQVQQVATACVTALATDGLRVHFGLGDATNAALVRIEWPSGIVQELTNVAPNQILQVAESQGYSGPAPAFVGMAIVTNGLQLSITEPAANARYILEASTNLVTWTKLMARTSAGGTTQFTDARAANYTRRFYRLQVP